MTFVIEIVTRHPPSDGAHRLAWWLSARGDDAIEQLAGRCLPSFAFVDGLLSGEIEPNGEIAAAIAHETGGAVLPEDWLRGGNAGWLDKPAERPR